MAVVIGVADGTVPAPSAPTNAADDPVAYAQDLQRERSLALPGSDSARSGQRRAPFTWLREPGDIKDYHAFTANVREVRNHEPAPGFGPQTRPRAGVIPPVQIDH